MSDTIVPDGFKPVEVPSGFKPVGTATKPLSFPDSVVKQYPDIDERLQASEQIGRFIGTTPAFVHQNFDQVTESMYGEPEKPKGVLQKFKNIFQSNWMSINIGELRFRQIMGDDSEELEQQIQDIKSKMPNTEETKKSLPLAFLKTLTSKNELSGTGTGKLFNALATAYLTRERFKDMSLKERAKLPEEALMATATILPSQLKAAEAGMRGGLLSGLGTMGASAAFGNVTPQGLATAFGWGMMTGGRIFAAEKMLEMEAGAAYDEILDMEIPGVNPQMLLQEGASYSEMIDKERPPVKVNPMLAKATSLLVGAGNAGLEYLQGAQVLKHTGLGNIVNKALGETITQRIASGGIQGMLSKVIGKNTTFIALETLQEYVQEMNTATFAELSLKVENAIQNLKDPARQQEYRVDWEKVRARGLETAYTSAMGFGVMSLGGTFKTIVTKQDIDVQQAVKGTAEKADQKIETQTGTKEKQVPTTEKAVADLHKLFPDKGNREISEIVKEAMGPQSPEYQATRDALKAEIKDSFTEETDVTKLEGDEAWAVSEDIVEEIEFTPRQEYEQEFRKTFTGQADEEMQGSMEMFDRMAEAQGLSPDELAEKYMAGFTTELPADQAAQADFMAQASGFHGSPKTFDRLSTEYVDTGEHNQAFGWGIYIAEEEAYARGYADKLSKVEATNPEKAGEILGEITNAVGESMANRFLTDLRNGDMQAAKETANIYLHDDHAELEVKVIAAIDSGELSPKKARNIYSTTLFKGKTEGVDYQWLDWAKPAPESTVTQISEALQKEVSERTGAEAENFTQALSALQAVIKEKGDKLEGKDVYLSLKQSLDSGKNASLFLDKYGIDGIRYPSGTLSGIKDSDTSNYVVFNDKNIDIEAHTLYQKAKQTESEAFKKWFGNSKVVDENGKPLVVYHGTAAEVTKTGFAFDEKQRGKNYNDEASRIGFFFAKEEEGAQQFGKNIIPVYLKINRMFVIDEDVQSEFVEEWLRELEEVDPEEYEFQIATKAYNNSKDINKGVELAVIDAKASGYDGVKVVEEEDADDWYIVFSPTQIKSATENTGAFDPTNPNIQAQSQQSFVKAAVQFNEAGKALIYASKQADFSSYSHEMAHIYDHYFLRGKERATVEKWLGVKDGVWTTENREQWANGFEQYLREGKAPSKELATIFEKMKEWLTDIYDRFQKMKMPEEVVSVYDAILYKEPLTPELQKMVTEAEKTVDKDTVARRLKETRYIKDPEERLRILTGKMKLGEAIAEVRPLVKVAQKEAVQVEKERKALVEKEKKERKELRQYFRDLAKKIFKKVPSTVDFYYKEAIEAIKAKVDPMFRQKRTLGRREKIRQFLTKNPEKTLDMPPKLLELLDKKPLNEMTIEELESMVAEVKRLTEQGRLKRKLTLEAKKREVQETIQELTTTIMQGEELKKREYIGSKEDIKESRRRIGKTVRATTLRMMRILDKFDGGADFKGLWHKVFYNDVNKTVDIEYKNTDKRRDAFFAKMKELGFKPRDFAKTIKVDGITYSVDDVMDMYAGFQNRIKKLAITEGNKALESKIQEFIDKLTPEQKAFVEYGIGDYEANRERLRTAHITRTNEDMGDEENYTPLRRLTPVDTEIGKEVADEIADRENIRKGRAFKGMTKRRTMKGKYQLPIRLGFVSTWIEMVPKQEHYIESAEQIDKMQRILSNENIRNAIAQKYGKEYHAALQKYVDRVANPDIYKAYTTIDKASRFLRKNVAIAYLSYNIVTMGKQLPSLALMLGDVGIHRMIASAGKMIANPMKLIDEVNGKDPQMKHRSIDRAMEELRISNKNLYTKIVGRIGKTGMAGIKLMDKTATTIGWDAVYQANIAKGLSEEEAIHEAQNAILRTQPAAHAKDVAEIYASNEFLNWFTMFSNQLNQIYNMATYDVPTALKSKKFYRAFGTTTGLAISSLAIWMMTHKDIPDKPEEITEALMETAINMIPIVGKDIMNGMNGYSSGIPITKLPISMGRLLKDVAGGQITPYTMRLLWEGMSVSAGTPYAEPNRIRKAIETGDWTEVFGYIENKKPDKKVPSF